MNIPNEMKAAASLGAILGLGFGLGRLYEATQPTVADEYTPVLLKEDGMVSVQNDNGEVVNVYYGVSGQMTVEFPISNYEIAESFSEWMFDDRVVTNTFKARNDYHASRLFLEDQHEFTNDELDALAKELEEEDRFDPYFYDDEFIDLMSQRNYDDEELASE